MDKQTLFKSLDGFMTYETGATDAGIHDPTLRAQVFEYFNGLPIIERDTLLIEWTEIFKDEGDLQESLSWLQDNHILPAALRDRLE